MNRKVVLLLFIIACLFLLGKKAFYSNNILHSFYEDKIWIHRVNSVKKLKEVEQLFKGIEVDIIYQDSVYGFDVNHPPATSIGLNLSSYLSSLKDKNQTKIWLDFKNLDSSNQTQALSQLNQITEKLSIPKYNIIVESSKIECLDNFYKKGYQVSLYVHWPGLYTLPDNERESLINEIEKSIHQNNFNGYLSSDYRDYEILLQHFPTQIKLFWLDDSFGEKNKFSSRLKLFKILSDDNVKVLLMKYKSKSGER